MCSLGNQFMRNSTSFDSKYSHTRCFDLFFFLFFQECETDQCLTRKTLDADASDGSAKVLNEYNWQREIVIQICA